MKRAVAAAGSVLLHLLVVLALVLTPTRHPKPPPKHAPVALQNSERPGRLRGEIAGSGLACGGYHYTGIGITYGAGVGRILDVGPDTPAERAGLVAGDVLIDVDQMAPDRFQPGHRLVLRVLRDNREIGVPIEIERICDEA